MSARLSGRMQHADLNHQQARRRHIASAPDEACHNRRPFADHSNACRGLSRLAPRIVGLPTLARCAFLVLLRSRPARNSSGNGYGPELAGWAFSIAEDALWALLLAPVVIAVHRFVIQDVVTPAYALPLGDPTYRLFFVWLLALKILDGLAFDLLGVMQALAWPLWASTLGLVMALIASIAVSSRLTLLLPRLQFTCAKRDSRARARRQQRPSNFKLHARCLRLRCFRGSPSILSTSPPLLGATSRSPARRR